MKTFLSAAVLLFPLTAWADIAPSGCGCSVGASPVLASSLVAGALALLVFRRR